MDSTATRTKITKAEEVWSIFYGLATIACQARVNITEEEWRKRARAFGKLFTSTYQGRNTTPYMHIFIYHLGFFLEQYQGVEKFANYALECKHRVNKIRMRGGTNGFSGGSVQAAQQQLNAQLRMEHHQQLYPQEIKRGKKRGWGDTNLATQPTLREYVESEVQT